MIGQGICIIMRTRGSDVSITLRLHCKFVLIYLKFRGSRRRASSLRWWFLGRSSPSGRFTRRLHGDGACSRLAFPRLSSTSSDFS